MTRHALVEHFFRHEYGRLVAILSRRVGMQHLAAVEDAVQFALTTALESWTSQGLPDNPTAWLFKVAHNQLMEGFRQQAGQRRILERNTDVLDGALQINPLAFDDSPKILLQSELQDELLKMLFVCCDDAIPLNSQVVLALKTLCGFSVQEISIRLFTSEANVYKRLGRARSRLRVNPPHIDELDSEQCSARLPAVHRILYVLFTEGYQSSHAEVAIRRELCEEALRLANVLAKHPVGQKPETSALIALMYLHLSRLNARQDKTGGLLLLEEQDRSQLDQHSLQLGLEWLARSAQGNAFSRYHAEAAIVTEHCLAPTIRETRWQNVAECYALLEGFSASPLHTLNRSVAVAEWLGPAAGLDVLSEIEPPAWLASSYEWAAVNADLHQRCGHAEIAQHYREIAFRTAPTDAVKALLRRRLVVGESV